MAWPTLLWAAAACLQASHVLAAPLLEGRGACSSNDTTLPHVTSVHCAANATEPVAPLVDPWYAGPRGFESAAPGAVLCVRPAPGNLTALAGNSSTVAAAYQILYRTTGSDYRPTWAVTTLFVPRNRTRALLSYQIPYDSVSLDASPSYAMYGSGGVPTDVSQALAKGWFVNVPDYEGPKASFTAGVLSGHATLDSLRAVLGVAGGGGGGGGGGNSTTSSRFGLLPNTSYALWGYSGGALASEWAAELQVQYAPELNVSGAALGGLTPNVTSVLYTVYETLEAGLVPPAILGISNQFPDVYDYVLSKLKTEGPYNKTGFLATLNYTLSQNIAAYGGQNISEYFVDGLNDTQGRLPQRVIHSDGVMGYHGVPQFPLYAYKPVGDRLSPVNDTDVLVARYCEMGVQIDYDRLTVGGHSAGSVNGHAAAVAWLESVFNGSYARTHPTTACRIQNVAVNISSSPF